jgi:hypothetical protein
MDAPGKYHDICTYARETAKADGAILIIINGEHGQGMDTQLPPEMESKIPDILRYAAYLIEQTQKTKN